LQLSKQQKQTKFFFDKASNQWSHNAHLKSDKILNVIKQRNQYVTNVSRKFLSKKSKILDVGSGSGELVIGLSKLGFDAQGIDFSESMIKKAKRQAMKNKVEKNKFICDSFFDYSFDGTFDLICANGFIEYISEDQFQEFLKKTYNLLSKNGILIINSINRLFNIFSFNDYTKDEIKYGNLNSLIDECVVFNSGKSLNSVLKNKRSKIKTNLKKHTKTGIDVDTRFQYTPFQIFERLAKNHFKPFDIFPIHIHVFTTESRKEFPDFHNQVSNFVQNKKSNKIAFIPQSSSFMVLARKK
jgi:2-polyprenyl-3-methyl-5-hydroxy-6-metoxy-1,4-benzoquinol methylase